MIWGSPASRALEPVIGRVASEARDLQLIRNPEAARFYGAEALRGLSLGAEAHVRVLSDALALNRPGLFAREMVWASLSLEPRGFPVEDLVDLLEIVKRVVGDRAPEAAEASDEAIDLALGLLARAPCAPSHLRADRSGTRVAEEVLARLLHLEHEAAERVLVDAIDAGLPLCQAYEEVLFPVIREVGRLWQLGRASVADEHYASAALREMAARLGPRLASPHEGRTAVVACVETDLHDLGARLVADLLEARGWEAVFLGAGTPADALLGLLHVRKPAALLISATRCHDLRCAAGLIAKVREQAGLRGLPLVVGGAPFAEDATLHEAVGADARAVDAEQAHEAATALGVR